MQIAETTTDHELEILLGRLLRVGVSIAATLVISGAVWYLLRHGQELAAYRVFKPLDSNRPGVKDVFEGIAAGRGRSLIQAGLLVLIATPVARVVFSLVAFTRQRDWIYVTITLIVLAVLLFSFFGA